MSSIRCSLPSARLALVDGNNFYVSCERVFQPKLIGKPVIVLSNNDGCAVSRSQEAKALGVAMGQPFFKIPPEIRRQGLVALSSNYPLYADLSERMMRLAGEVTPRQEIYSIDESFLDLAHWPAPEVLARAAALRAKIGQWIGIPTCIGIGPSKTLAKLANHVAKRNLSPAAAGVFDWSQLSPVETDCLLERIPVGDVWGVGRRLRTQLEALNIGTACALKRADREMIRQRFGVVLARTVDELNGVSCLSLDEHLPDKQQIMTSRSFAHPLTDKALLAAAIADFATRSASKLRQQRGVANAVHVFAQTDRFADSPQYRPALTIPLSVATDDTLRIVRAALYALNHFFRPDVAYKKAGVMLMGLERRDQHQPDLFSRFDEMKSARLMSVLDRVNQRFGAHALRPALTAGVNSAWAGRRERRSGSYTTSWSALPIAWCDALPT